MIARSYLYVPANNSEMLKKAPNRGADALIVDLEDSVAFDQKAKARENLASWLEEAETSVQIWIRINAETIDEDLSSLSSNKIHGLVIPKATYENVSYVSQKSQGKYKLSALIETADSILDARRIATIQHIAFLQIGALDLRAQLGLSDSEELDTLKYAQSHLVLASAAAGINQPIAPIYRDFNDEKGLAESCEYFRNNGFFGRSCIHPKQVEVINSAFDTSPEAIAEARAILDAVSNSQGVTVDSKGRMIDLASVRVAQRVIESIRSE